MYVNNNNNKNSFLESRFIFGVVWFLFIGIVFGLILGFGIRVRGVRS